MGVLKVRFWNKKIYRVCQKNASLAFFLITKHEGVE